jgi:hypothetical protein
MPARFPVELLGHLGAEPILCDVFNWEALIQAVRDFNPDVVLSELTDLPDDVARISELADLNARIRTEGTQKLIEAARRIASPKILAQSVAWQLPDGPDAQAVAELERSVLTEGGVATADVFARRARTTIAGDKSTPKTRR